MGTGLYSIAMVALVGLFIAGLMTGRTPEYLGKKIGPGELKLIAIFSLVTPISERTRTSRETPYGPKVIECPDKKKNDLRSATPKPNACVKPSICNSKPIQMG